MPAGMTVYVRRAIQARMRDAREYSMGLIFNGVSGHYTNFGLYREYEPYYLNQVSDIRRHSQQSESLLGGGTTGIYRKRYNDTTIMQRDSEVAPPWMAD